MREVLLVRFGEVHLKGANRPYFLRMLTENVRHSVKELGAKVWLADSRIYVAEIDDVMEAAERVRRVFGVHSVSPAYETEKDIDQIGEACVRLMADKSGTFKVVARRSDKSFPMQSNQIGAEMGHRVLESNAELSVDVHEPEIKLHVEVRDMAYICCEEIMGAGGMPTGTGGKAALLLSGGIDSPVAGYSIMRRGVKIASVHFESPPYTGERAKEKVLSLAKKLGEFQGGMQVAVVPFTKIQLEIHEKCPEDLGTVLMRRYMMRIAERVAAENFKAQALITGENLAQVASQTMEALCCTDIVVGMPVFRPLIGLDKLDIIREAEKIDTYETSILPYEDCCTVFTPRHPNTKPKPKFCEKAEERLDSEALIEEAIAGTRIINC
ncbi:MAG: tRNA uracil 4-sulfurtransferase ThiI [Eubacteriales bacterium]|nr:tRNA uracil 4-sulfurtransferase ThiI [Eubacteriales bacterium]